MLGENVMIPRQLLLVLVALTWLVAALPGTVRGDVRRDRSARRPYIVEIGEPYSITPATLQSEAIKMTELREYMSNYGQPDYAEIQEIGAEWPWDAYEVRLYYLRPNVETDFGHVLFSPAMPDLGVTKFQGQIPASKRHEIEVILAARQAPPAAAVVESPAAPSAPAKTEEPSASGLTEALVARIEAAAERATQAADRAAEQSEAAMRAADRTTTIVNKIIETAPPVRRGR